MKFSAKLAGIAIAGILGSACLAASAQASTTSAARHQAWRTSITRTAVPGKGCFEASFPVTVWHQVKCGVAPNIPYIPASGASHGGNTVGDGDDYLAETSALTQSATGSFPKVKHLKSETGFGGGQNVYTLQLNSNFMSNDQACANAADPSKCLGWEQFVYSSSEHATFIQYWLIYYDKACPGGWNTYSASGHTFCWKNSDNAANTPKEPITDLKQMSLTGTAVHGGIDTINMVDGDHAYSITQDDTTMYLADGWTGSEFNVIGDGGGSQANFNAGTSLTVKIDLTDGTKKKPACTPNAGTTGETNNLNLGACKAFKGKGDAVPYVQFVESLPKK